MDDERNLKSTASTDLTRRRLLRAATGGFALAASGLFLPAALGETKARAGALGGAKGGRHGKDHNGQHRHRSHGDKKDKSKDKDNRPPGGELPAGGIRYVAIRATGGGFGRQPMHVTFYYRTLNAFGQWSALKLGKVDDIPKQGNVDYAPKMYSTAVYFSLPTMPYPVLVEVTNPLFSLLPLATVVWGCSIDDKGTVVGGSTYRKDGDTEIPQDGLVGNIEFRTGEVNTFNTHVMVSLIQTTNDYYWISALVDDFP